MSALEATPLGAGNAAPPREAPAGLSSVEARRRLAQSGPNEIPEPVERPLRRLLRKLWSPVAWLLEVSVLLELALHHRTQAAIISALLVFNALLGFFQEGRAQAAVDLLRKRLAIRARVRRDGTWGTLPARELVPGDLVRLRVGDVTPADCRLLEGQLLEDRSVITGESVAQEVAAGAEVSAGTTLRRGEATAEVLRTGATTRFGKTAALVQGAGAKGQIETLILRIVRVLIAVDGAVAAVVLIRAVATDMPGREIVPFILMLLVASVPVALQATFTLATALGSRELSTAGVLTARLQALEAAAAMDVLCCDKTGTVTENKLTVAGLAPLGATTEAEVLRLAGLASDRATQDPIDLAIFAEVEKRGIAVDLSARAAFEPFDTSTKRSEARLVTPTGKLRVAKGAPPVLAALAGTEVSVLPEAIRRLGLGGSRVLGVASGPEDGALQLAGLIALTDPPRPDSRAVLERLRALGLRVVMLTGDSLETARTVARQVDIPGETRSAKELREAGFSVDGAGVIAEVFPEDKLGVVRALQQRGHLVGMTGDGVNDAPALRQADVGVAVAGATDVARAAAALVLLGEGLSGMVPILEIGRGIHQRLFTYTLNKIVKTLQTVLFLGGWFLFDGTLAVTPRLIVLLLFANDFVTMSLATDHVEASPQPERWNVRQLGVTGLWLALLWVAFGVAALLLGRHQLGLSFPQLQTLSFLVLVFTGQGTIYAIRARRRVFGRRPSAWLAGSSLWAIGTTSLLAAMGWWMAPLPVPIIAGLVAAVACTGVIVSGIKALALAWSGTD